MGAQVLVADDDRALRESLARSLELEGYTVATASDGATALTAVHETTPEAVVLDVMMPNVDGLTVCSPPARSPDVAPAAVAVAAGRVAAAFRAAAGAASTAGARAGRKPARPGLAAIPMPVPVSAPSPRRSPFPLSPPAAPPLAPPPSPGSSAAPMATVRRWSTSKTSSPSP